MRFIKFVGGIVGIVMLSACVAMPPSLEGAPESSLAIAAVQQETAGYVGNSVMWGGAILKIENSDDKTRVWVVAKPLYRNGAPASGDQTQGRFIAEFDQFFDPALYAVGRKLTVMGTVAESVTEMIDEHSYVYPLVAAESHQLWPKQIYAAVYPHHRYWFDDCRRAYRRGYYDPLHPRNIRQRHRCHGLRRGVFLSN